MQPSFVKKLYLYIYKTDIDIWKIDSNRLKTFDIVITSFSVNNKDGRSYFFKETFLLAKISMNVALGIFFLTLNKIKINFTN